MTQRAWLAVLATAIVSTTQLSGCAPFVPPQTAALQAQRPPGLPERAELGATPFFPQTDYQCGPAALATVLGAAGLPASPAELAEDVFLPARQGSLQIEMLAGARRHGALAVRLPGELAALLREVAAGRPVLVLQNLGLAIAPAWHYAVLVGYDLEHGDVILRSGTTQREVMALRTFEHTWARSGHWAFAAIRPGELALTASETETTAATVALERNATAADAVRAYEAALQRWPGSLTLAIGLGNTHAAAGALPQAAAAFEHAAQRHGSAVAWNNLAQMRLKQGRRDDALDAARHAVERATTAEPQWLPMAQATLAESQVAGR